MRPATAILYVILCILTSCIHDKPEGADLAVTDNIPDFSVTMNDGKVVTGEQLRDGISVVVFFTTKCPDCQTTLPHLQRLYDEYQPQGVKFALISREDGEDSVAQYWAENDLTMPYSAQNDRKIYEKFATSRVPRVYLCRFGTIKYIFTDDPNPTYDIMSERLQGLMIKF